MGCDEDFLVATSDDLKGKMGERNDYFLLYLMYFGYRGVTRVETGHRWLNHLKKH